MVELPKNVSLYMILRALVQQVFLKGGASGHFGFGPLAENAMICLQRPGGKICHKRSIDVKSIFKPS